MKKVSLALVVALLLVTTGTVHAEAQTWVENLGGGKRVTVTTQRILTSEEYANLASVGVSKTVGVGLAPSPVRGDTSALTPVNTFFNESRLFLRGFGDVWKATSGLGDQGNLQDPRAKYEYWKQQGIYDKYTPGQISFINKVVFPAVAAARGLAFAGSVGLAALGIAAIAGLSVLPVAAVIGAAAIGLTGIKWLQVKKRNADIAGKGTPKNEFLLSELALSGGLAGTYVVNALSGPTALTPAAPILAGAYGTLVNSYGAVKLLNAWGIPEVGGQQQAFLPPPDSPWNQTVTDSQNYTIDYRITK